MTQIHDSRYLREHPVPRSYLRRFSPNGTHVYVYDKATGQVALVATSNIAQAAVPECAVELQLEKWEGELSDVTDTALRVAAGGAADPEVRRSMSICVAVQLTRSRATGERPAAGGGGIPELAADLYHFVWQIGINGTDTPLVTSDSPVVRCNDDSDQLVYPLTPAVALMMYHPRCFEGMPPGKDRARHLSLMEVERCNALQLLGCRSQAYSRKNIFWSMRDAASAWRERVHRTGS